MEQVNGSEAPSVCVNILALLPSSHSSSRAPIWPVHAFLWAVCSKEMKEFPPGVWDEDLLLGEVEMTQNLVQGWIYARLSSFFFLCESKVDFLGCKNEIIEEKSRRNRHGWLVPRKMSPIHVSVTLSFYVLRVRYENKLCASQVCFGNKREKEMCALSKVKTGKGKKQNEAMMLL